MHESVWKLPVRRAAGAFLVALAVSAGAPAAHADEDDAKALLKAMSDYLGSQSSLAFAYDTDLEVVTSDLQKIAFASSGRMTLERPGKLHATRTGGFADVEIFYDGSTLTVFGKTLNAYTQAENVPGTIDELVDWLRANHNIQAPGADLLFANVYDQLMPHVTDVKDLGQGVIRGTTCDHIAFRTEDVDWQIWIAAGAVPYPCRYVVTSRLMAQAPEYRIEISDWTAGGTANSEIFSFVNTTEAKEVQIEDLAGLGELPNLAAAGE